MELRITGRTAEQLKENFIQFMNLATMICLKGHVPTPHEIANAENQGMWWCDKNSDGKSFSIIGTANNIWLNVRDKDEDFIDVEFTFRYDGQRVKEKAICNCIVAFLDFVDAA